MDNFTEPGHDVVVGRGPVGEEEVLMTEAAALEAFRVVDLLIQPDDRRQVVELEVGRDKSADGSHNHEISNHNHNHVQNEWLF